MWKTLASKSNAVLYSCLSVFVIVIPIMQPSDKFAPVTEHVQGYDPIKLLWISVTCISFQYILILLPIWKALASKSHAAPYYSCIRSMAEWIN